MPSVFVVVQVRRPRHNKKDTRQSGLGTGCGCSPVASDRAASLLRAGAVGVLVLAALARPAAPNGRHAQHDEQQEEYSAHNCTRKRVCEKENGGPTDEAADPPFTLVGVPSRRAANLLLGARGAAAAAANDRHDAQGQNQRNEDPLHLRAP